MGPFSKTALKTSSQAKVQDLSHRIKLYYITEAMAFMHEFCILL